MEIIYNRVKLFIVILKSSLYPLCKNLNRKNLTTSICSFDETRFRISSFELELDAILPENRFFDPRQAIKTRTSSLLQIVIRSQTWLDQSTVLYQARFKSSIVKKKKKSVVKGETGMKSDRGREVFSIERMPIYFE